MGGGEQHGDAVAFDVGQQLLRPLPVGEQRRGADAEREDDQTAEAEGEPQGWAAREDVVGARAQDVRGEGVGDGQHVPVEVRAALGCSGGAGGERDQCDVVGGGVRGRIGCGFVCREPQKVVRTVAAETSNP
ncbi:hypothetical protein GCM10020000_18700 [Streptomyces olivoverticillatus]